MGKQQVWEGTVEGRVHRVESRGDVVRTHVWSVDGEQVAEKKTMDDKVTLKASTAAYDGALLVRFSSLGGPRRATVLPHEGLGELGLGGTDLAPEPGSAAARHHEKLLAHPTRYTMIATLGGVAKVVVPILLVALLARFAVNIPWPDINIPFPDLPSIPSPNLPSIPWPDANLPDWSLPGWLAWIVDNVKYIAPVVLAFVFARAEISRRRRQSNPLVPRRTEPGAHDDQDEDETPQR